MKSSIGVTLLICVAAYGCGCPQPAAIPPPESNRSIQQAPAAHPEPQSRRLVFHYNFRIKDLQRTGSAEQDLVRVWVPRPDSSEYQTVEPLAVSAPAMIGNAQEPRYGNWYRYLESPIPDSGEFTVELPYDIKRREVRTNSDNRRPMELNHEQRAQLLAATELVPTTGKPLELIKDVKLAEEPLTRARQLYDVVDQHVVYKKEGTGWGRGDTNWVCQSGYGNCTDFHSLFMSLARSQGLPAKFEIGFSIPTDKTAGPIAGYHCWAWFHTPERGWIPVDISEADKHPEMKDYYFGNLTADRVTFSVGRDLQLEPPPAAGPLNFFVFPHIEVGGKVLPKEQLELQFSFEDKSE